MNPQINVSQKKRLFKYYPEDFGELSVTVIHMDLTIEIYDDHSVVHSDFHAKTKDTPLETLNMNAKDLEILDVRSEEQDVSWHFDSEASRLSVTFSPPIPPQSSFSIHTETICRPTKNILEGLYYDETPPGAPPTQITQCQQWGFQRIVPCIDDMTAKCTYTTNIIADGRYTNLISNGDISVPRHSFKNGRDSVTFDNRITPMAPYLFFLGAGTYATFAREFEYPDGHKFRLELLVPPESGSYQAERALDILADAVLWVYLFTGPEQYRDPDRRLEIYKLALLRDRLVKEQGDPLEIDRIQKRLAALSHMITPGYRYTGTVYREIGMQNSDFGGMENVGNTTISTNRIIPFLQMTDSGFEYMIRVKVHEFYHNLNGSEVTGRSPFEIWLNEAVTVHIERMYHAFAFGESYSRLQTVLTLLSPDGGTFFYDRGAGSMPIEPDGFNDPNELITGVTYVKAPEFVRMIETIMEREPFVRALALYHTRYRHGNASREDWIAAMEEISGQSFSQMANGWLKKTGYPDIHVTATYDSSSREYIVHLNQTGEKDESVWEFPFVVAIVAEDGTDIAKKTIWVKNREEKIVFFDVQKPAFLSLNRGYSAYGKVHYNVSPDELHMQVWRDSDVINRFIALYRLLDREKMRILENEDAEVSEKFCDLMVKILSDGALMSEMGGQFLTIFESVDDESFAHRYTDLYNVKQKIQRAIAERHRDRLLEQYHRYASLIGGEPDMRSCVMNIKYRQVKNAILGILSSLDSPDIRRLQKEQYLRAENATDKIVAFGLYLNSSAEDRWDVLDRFETEARKHPVSWEAFLSVVAGSSAPDVVAMVRHIESSSAFRIEQTNDQRSLFARFAQNKKKSLQTEEGRKYLLEMLIRLANINEYSTVNVLSVFGNIDKMEEQYHIPLIGILVSILGKLDPTSTPSVYNTTRRLLRGAPVAVKRFEKSSGESLSDLL